MSSAATQLPESSWDFGVSRRFFALLAAALAGVGCAPVAGVFEGPTMLPVVLASDARVGLLPVRATSVTVLVADLDLGAFTDSAVRDASLHVVPPGGAALPLRRERPGVWVLDAEEAGALGVVHGTSIALRADLPDAQLTIGAPVDTPPVQAVVPDTAVAGEDLKIAIPDGVKGDQLVVQLADADTGAILWDDLPRDLDDWLDFLSRRDVPKRVTVPGRLLEPGQRYLVSVAVLDRARNRALLLGPHGALSGFTAGTALWWPVVVGP